MAIRVDRTLHKTLEFSESPLSGLIFSMSLMLKILNEVTNKI